MDESTPPDIPTPQPAQIGLEMSKRTKISCLSFFILAVFLIVLACIFLRMKGRNDAEAVVSSVYSSVGRQPMPSYAELSGSILSASAEQTLRIAATLHGQIQSWRLIKSETGIVGRPSTVLVAVKRNDKDYVDLVVTVDNEHIAVVEEFTKEDWDAGREDKAIRVIAK